MVVDTTEGVITYPRQDNIEMSSQVLSRFSYYDYAVFVLMLIFCSLIGIYFGYKDHQNHKKNRLKSRRGSEALNYLVGGRNLQVFPVAMSLVATFISGITLLGTSTEIYLYGTQYCFILIAVVLCSVFMYFTIIPVFHDLQITSTYEYLESRYNKKVRTFCSCLFAITAMLWMPIVIYVPALAFNQVTDINVHIISPVVCLVCIFYTLVGGIKAVIWTDVVQIIIMYGVLILIVIKGTLSLGGLSVVLDRNLAGGRFEYPDFRIDPTIRHTFWSLAIGGTIFWINTNGLSQSMMQRYLSLNSVKTARKALMMYTVGVIAMILLCAYNGLLVYATYYDCDPLQTKLAKKKDQLLPLMVINILKDLPGLTGLFIAGVFSAALSSLSTGLNSMAAVVLEDFFKSFTKRQFTERETAIIMRLTVFIVGIIAVSMVYVIQHLGSVLQLSMSLSSSCFGPMLGIYLMGMFLPWINSNGALIGGIVSLLISSYITVKVQFEIAMGKIIFETKPLSVEGCEYDFFNNQTVAFDPQADAEKSLHNMSYLYYTGFGASVAILVGVLFSAMCGFNDPSDVDPMLLVPFIRKFFKSKSQKVELAVNGKHCIVHTFEEKDNQIIS